MSTPFPIEPATFAAVCVILYCLVAGFNQVRKALGKDQPMGVELVKEFTPREESQDLERQLHGVERRLNEIERGFDSRLDELERDIRREITAVDAERRTSVSNCYTATERRHEVLMAKHEEQITSLRKEMNEGFKAVQNRINDFFGQLGRIDERTKQRGDHGPT